MSLGLEVSFRSLLGLYTDFKFTVSASFYPKQKIVNTMSVEEVILEPVYPALYHHYETRPVGRAVLSNLSASDLEKIEVTFFIEGQMDKPRVCDAPLTIGPRGEHIIELHGLFDERILSIQEDTELTCEIFVTHKAEGWKFKQTIEKTVPFNGKNNITLRRFV